MDLTITNSIKEKVRVTYQSSLIRNSSWMFLGNISRVGIQALYFVVIARALGSVGFGAFAGVTALVAIFAPYASWGVGNILVKEVSRDVDVFPAYWGKALYVTVVSGLSMLLVVSLAARYLLPASIPVGVIIVVVLTDLIFTRLLDVCGQAYQAFNRLKRTAQFQAGLSLSRLIAALFLLLFPTQSPVVIWSVLYFLSGGVCVAVAIFMVCRELGGPLSSPGWWRVQYAEGFYFSLNLSAQTINNDVDKTLLTHFSTLESTGIYAAAYKVIDVSFTPVRSVLFASYSKFFARGVDGIRGSITVSKRLLPLSVAYSVLVSVALFISVPMIPKLVGSDYSEVVEAVRWLAFLPLLKSIQYFGADTLTGAGYQKARCLIYLTVAVFNLLINLWLIPLYSWRGAAWSSLLCDFTLAALIWVVVWVKSGQPVIAPEESLATY
jgi:O-antigen/teichoic acid export membrane protein